MASFGWRTQGDGEDDAGGGAMADESETGEGTPQRNERYGGQFLTNGVAESQDTEAETSGERDLSENYDDLGESFLPPFANAENKELDLQIRQTEKDLERTEVALEEHKDRITIMREHLRNVHQEILYTQSRADARKRETETEVHLRMLSERESGRLRVEVARLEKEAEELHDKMNALQNAIFKGNEKMDQFRLLMNWNQEEMEQWALASRQKEEDNAVLAKYTRQDESKVKELGLAIERGNKRLHSLHQELEAEVTETQAAQIMLDKTAADFKALHEERQELVRQWEEAVEAMRKRDVSIQRAAEMFADNKLRIREKTQQLDARAKFLENEQANNREMEGKIVFAERSLAKQKQSLDAESARTKEMNEEVELLRNSLSSAATDLAMQRSTNAQSREELDSKKRKVEAARKRVAAVVRKLQTEFAALDTLEKRTKELSEMYSVEEGRLRTAQKDVAELKDLQFKTSQELYQLRIQERDLAAEINGGQAQAKNLAEKIRNLDGDMVKQQEVLYAAEFQIQALERKVARAAGERSDQEKRELTTKINQLQAILDDKSSEHAMLTAQVKKSEEDLLAARRRGEDCQKEVSLLNGKIAELTLESDTAVRTVKTAVREKEDKMVAHDILKLEVKRLTDILNFRADEVYGLENRKYQLQMAMEERKHEIEVLHEGLRAHLKSALEDIHRSTLEKKERGLRVAKLQAKYEVLLGKVKKEEGEEHSQAYYVIRAAQEREALQREGDLLDSQIRQAEREVRALEATLHNLNERNLMYRDSFKVGGSAEAAAEQAALRQRLDKAFDRLKFKRSEESSLVQDLEQFESRLGNIEREEEQIGGQLDDLQRRADLAGRDWQEQIEKTKRAVSRLERLRKNVRERLGPDKAAKFEEEVLLAELRETTRIALLEIRAAINEDPSVGVLVEAAVVGAGLRLPSGTTSGTSSRASTRSGGGSVASSVSGRSVSSRGSIASRGSVASNASSRGGVGAQSQGSRAPSRAPSVHNMELNLQR